MDACISSLPNDPALKAWGESLIAENQSLLARNKSLQAELALEQEKIRLLIQKRFGVASEKTSPGQMGLFNEAEQDQPEESDAIVQAETDITVPAHRRKKPGRKPLPENLPRVQQVHDLSEEDKVCTGCGHRHLHRIGEEISEQLDIIPAKIRLIQHVRPKYACPANTGQCCSTGAAGLHRHRQICRWFTPVPAGKKHFPDYH